MTTEVLVSMFQAAAPYVSSEELMRIYDLADAALILTYDEWTRPLKIPTIVPPHLAQMFRESCAIGRLTEEAEAWMILNALAKGAK